MLKNYLCANRHHFRSATATCPTPSCAAEVRPTDAHPLHDPTPAFAKLPPLPPDERPAPAPATPAPGVKHAIRWWAYVDGERVRRTSSMKDGDFGWDATCAPCGWDSRTGGALMSSVDRLVQDHKKGIL